MYTHLSFCLAVVECRAEHHHHFLFPLIKLIELLSLSFFKLLKSRVVVMSRPGSALKCQTETGKILKCSMCSNVFEVEMCLQGELKICGPCCELVLKDTNISDDEENDVTSLAKVPSVTIMHMCNYRQTINSIFQY